MIDTKKLTKEFNNLEEGAIVLIETTAEKILEVNLVVVKWLSDKKYTQIILSTSRPCKNLLDLYKKNNIDINKIRILCAVCQNKKQENSNIIHIQSSSSLTEISLALSKCMESIKDKKFIFIDSINTMLVHNDSSVLAKFIHFVLTKMRTNNVSGLLISLKIETNKEVKAEISQLCDKIIEV